MKGMKTVKDMKGPMGFGEVGGQPTRWRSPKVIPS